MNGCPKCINKITPKRKIFKVKLAYVNRTKEINKIASSTLHTLTKPFKIPRNFQNLNLKSQSINKKHTKKWKLNPHALTSIKQNKFLIPTHQQNHKGV
jgi:hypothetical protein